MKRTGSYRGRDSYVDEGLFGNGKPGSAKNGKTDTTGSIKKSASFTLPPVGHNLNGDAVSLKRADLERMLKPSPVMSPEEITAARRRAEADKEAAQAVSKARKARMMALEAEARRGAAPSETELLKMRGDAGMLSRASRLLVEEKDAVKNMNQMMLYSKCVTVRDAQVEEKKQIMAEEEEEQRRLDMMMEVERVKAVEQYEERERGRNAERVRGAAVLKEQIADRLAERLRQEELRDQERIAMLKEGERLKEEEMQAAVEKKAAAKVLLAEVAAANAEQIGRKEVMKVREREEDMKISAYLRAKAIREAELVAEKERIAHEKEMEVARLRAQQERAADKQSELDELRARRYQEAKEREWRGKERAAAERQAALFDELAVAREAQKNVKVQQRSEMARVEHREFMRVLDVNKQKEREDMELAVSQMAINHRHKEALLGQIQANDEKRRRERQEHLEEGARIRAEAAREQQLLLGVKAAKLEELVGAGVPAKYRAELEKMKIPL